MILKIKIFRFESDFQNLNQNSKEKTNLVCAQGEDDFLEREMVYFRWMEMCIFIGVVITGYACETYQTMHLTLTIIIYYL